MIEQGSLSVAAADAHFTEAHRILHEWMQAPGITRGSEQIARAMTSLVSGLTVMRIWRGQIADRPLREVIEACNEANGKDTGRVLLNGRAFNVNSFKQETIAIPTRTVLKLELIDYQR